MLSLFKLGNKVNIKLYLICCFVIAIFFTTNINYYKKEIKNGTIIENFYVVENTTNYSIIENDKIKYLIYNNGNTFEKGNKILFEGELIDISNSHNSFTKYLNKQNIHYELRYYQFTIIDSSIKSNVLIINNLLKNKSPKEKSYLKLILFNVKDNSNKQLYNTFSIYSLTYLICISGFHINLLLAFLKKIFHNNLLAFSIVVFYLYLLDFAISSYRAFLCYIFKKINRNLNFNISNLEIISLIGCVFILINPSSMFSLSFIFSFLATLTLEIFKLYKTNKISISLYIYLINIPLILIYNYKLNFITIVLGIILSKPISILYILSFLFLFLNKLNLIYDLYITLLLKPFNFLNNYSFDFIFKPSAAFIILYYLFLALIFVSKERNRKIKYIYIFSLISLMIYQYYKPVLLYNEQIYFLNVGQGDCTVFFIPHSKEVVLVDTGGSIYKDIATTEIIPFLEEKGINKIRTILISHDDFDHNGALSSLKSNFNVENIINSSLFETVKIGKQTFNNLNISTSRDNDGSIVLYGEYAQKKILLMGDASTKIENLIKDSISNVDIIKIAHHGSNSSSDYEFLKKVNAKVAIISVGEKNNYNHPHEDVIERLKTLGYIVLRTDKNDNIGFGINLFNLCFVDYFD